MKKIKPDKAQVQQMGHFAAFQRKNVGVEKQTVEVAFSSEEPVERWFGDEVLSRAADAIDLSRLNDGGAVLFNHDWDDQIGVIEQAWIDADKRGRTLMHFGSGTKAAEKFQDVQDGILRHISVSYCVEDIVLDNPNVDDEDYRYIVTCWMPYEISFVTVPADPTVGVGRSAELFIESPVNSTPEKGNRNMNKNRIPADAETPTAAIPAAAATDTNNTAERGMQNERARVSELLAIGRSYATHGGIEVTEKVIKEGGSEAQLHVAIMANMQTKPIVTANEIGMIDREQREFSLLRTMSAAATDKWDKADLEREVPEGLEKRHGRAAAGFFVPADLIARAYSREDAANGGNVVGSDFREDLFIELLRNRLAVAQLGTTVLDGSVGDVTIPKHLTGNTVQRMDENGSAAESNATFEQMSLKPKTVTANTELSRKFILQSSLFAGQFARSELLKATMLGIDLAAINGKGIGNEPTGILNTADIGAMEIGANGGVPEWKHIVALESAIAAANADIGGLAHITNARVRDLLKTKLRADGVSGYIWQDGAAPLNGYRCAIPNQIPSNLARGTAANKCSPLVFDSWANLMIVYWGVLSVVVDPYTKSTTSVVHITTLQDVDIAVRHVESFAVIKDIAAA